MSREVGIPGDTAKADRSTMKRFKAWRVEREKRGLPPWVGPDDALFRTSAVQRLDVLKSSWTLRQWADDYCQSRNIFKEFVYEKVRLFLLSRLGMMLSEALGCVLDHPRMGPRHTRVGNSSRHPINELQW
jgi:hypothetical protein